MNRFIRPILLREAASSARIDRDQTINLGPPQGEPVAQSNYAVAPGEWIKEWLEEHHTSRETLAHQLGVTLPYMDSLLRGEIALSDELARALETLTGIPVTSWQRFDARYWEDKARLAADGEKAAAQLRRARRDSLLGEETSLISDLADER